MLVLTIYARRFISIIIKEDEFLIIEHLKTVARELAVLVPGEELAQYQTAEDIAKEGYLKLQDKLIDFAVEHQVYYAYYLRYHDEKQFQYIIDNDLDPATNVGLETPLESYEVEEGVLITLLEGHVMVDTVEDKAGPWMSYISAYAPVYDSQGNIVAAAGVDVSRLPLAIARRQLTFLTGLQTFVAAFVTLSGLLCVMWYRRQVRLSV
jgi:methyl-accepting chemotaxis protein